MIVVLALLVIGAVCAGLVYAACVASGRCSELERERGINDC